MRRALSGCLLMVLVAGIALAGGALWLGTRLLDVPAPAAGVRPTEAEASRGQQRLFELARLRRLPPGERPARIVLTAAELNGFLGRHLSEVGDVPLSAARVEVGAGTVTVAGRLPLGVLLTGTPVDGAGWVVPVALATRPVWLEASGPLRVDPPVASRGARWVRLEVERLVVGRQALPGLLGRLLLDPGTLRLLRWRLPDAVEGVEAEPGRLVFRVSASR